MSKCPVPMKLKRRKHTCSCYNVFPNFEKWREHIMSGKCPVYKTPSDPDTIPLIIAVYNKWEAEEKK
jgi:hypothetical protein